MIPEIMANEGELDIADFGRFSEPAVLSLISLADGPKHGYAMTQDIAKTFDAQLGPGTLYGAIARLEARGLISAIDSPDRRNPYAISELGQRALRLRLAALEAVARVGQGRLATA